MEEQLKKIKEKLKGVLKKKTLVKSNRTPTKDWQTIIVLGGITCVVLSVVGYYAFYTFNKEDNVNTETISTYTNIDTEKLNQVVVRYRERVNLFANLRSQTPTIPDPGVPEIIIEETDDELAEVEGAAEVEGTTEL